MTDKKSKIPSINELGKYAGKLFTDIKNSVKEIMGEYQHNHPGEKSSASKKAGEKKETTDEKPVKKQAKKTTDAKKTDKKES